MTLQDLIDELSALMPSARQAQAFVTDGKIPELKILSVDYSDGVTLVKIEEIAEVSGDEYEYGFADGLAKGRAENEE